MKSTPLPHWLVLGNSAIIVVISAGLAGWSTAMLSLGLDVGNVLLGFALLPCSLAVGILQYAAGFRRKIAAAEVVAVIHSVAFFLLGIASMWAVVAFINHGYSLSRHGPKMCLSIGGFLYCGFCVWMNERVRDHLRTAAEADDLPAAPVGSRRFQFTLRELLGAIVVLSIMASIARYTIHDANVNFREHITREEAPENLFQLPEGASDVCYYLSDSGCLAFEFTVDEEGFFRWTENILEISSASPTASISKIPQGDPSKIVQYYHLRRNIPFNDDSKYALIQQGYFCEYSNDDEWFRLGYDTATGRAYYCGSVLSQQQGPE